eukprot:776263-Pyramimonas_sp.AAC.2
MVHLAHMVCEVTMLFSNPFSTVTNADPSPAALLVFVDGRPQQHAHYQCLKQHPNTKTEKHSCRNVHGHERNLNKVQCERILRIFLLVVSDQRVRFPELTISFQERYCYLSGRDRRKAKLIFRTPESQLIATKEAWYASLRPFSDSIVLVFLSWSALLNTGVAWRAHEVGVAGDWRSVFVTRKALT